MRFSPSYTCGVEKARRAVSRGALCRAHGRFRARHGPGDRVQRALRGSGDAGAAAEDGRRSLDLVRRGFARRSISRLPPRVSFHPESAVASSRRRADIRRNPKKARQSQGFRRARRPAGARGSSPRASRARLRPRAISWSPAAGASSARSAWGAISSRREREAYDRLGQVSFEGMHFRTDIGLKEAGHVVNRSPS